MKTKITTEVVTKGFARSGPELRPDQIRLADEAQTSKNKVYTQSDLNQNGGGGGGGVAPDLSEYATKEALNTEADARDTGDKANLGLIESVSAKVNGNTTQIQVNAAAIAALDTSGDGPDLSSYYTKPEADEKFATSAELLQDHEAWTLADDKIKEAYKNDDQLLAERIRVVENDYTTTDDFNTLNNKVSQNKKDIAANTEAIAAIEIPEVEIPEQVTYLLQTDKVLRYGEPAIELVDSEGNFSNVKFVGANGIVVTSDMQGIKLDGAAFATTDDLQSYAKKEDIPEIPEIPEVPEKNVSTLPQLPTI